jgi:hypothetical protein
MVGIRDTRFPADNWHREEVQEIGRVLTICGTPIDLDVLDRRPLRRSEPTCPVCWAKR